MMSHAQRDGAALLILRVGLAWFMFLWAIHKVITPKQYQGLAKNFDGIALSFEQIYLVAAVQIGLCVLTALGVLRPFSYSALAVMHFFTVTRRWEGFLDPFALNDRGFPIHRNQVIDADAIYIRDPGGWESWSNEQLKHMAISAATIFESHDLALFCLDKLVVRKAIPADMPEAYVDCLPPELTKT